MNQKIGLYACVVAALQLTLYTFAAASGDTSPFIYFDPRIGIFNLEAQLWQHEVYPAVLSWFSALALGVAGWGLFRGRFELRVYLVVEAALMAPTVLFIVVVLLANMKPNHGFSIPELLMPILAFVGASLIPFLWAAWAQLRKNEGR